MPWKPHTLLQKLIRFDTTNPPGNEKACVEFIAGLLKEAGIESRFFARDPNRPNLVCRVSGEGRRPPVLLYGHVDVVPTAGQEWTHPPFSGEMVDGYVWGRGALDMKGGVAMMVSALLKIQQEKIAIPGDVVLALVCDEERGGEYGAKFLVEEHPECFEGIRFALGEFGGFPLFVGGKKFYLIQVSEKQYCWLKIKIRGPAGHGSLPFRGGAMARLGQILTQLDKKFFPIHLLPVVRQMIETMADHLESPLKETYRRLLDGSTADEALEELGSLGRLLGASMRNTLNATMVQGGTAVNVIPGEITLSCDGRLLPGQTPDDLIRELKDIIGDDVEIEVDRHEPGPPEPDMALFDTLSAILEEADPGAVSLPWLVPGVTDARTFARLGIQTYGFLPMNLPEDFPFMSTIHAADERIPVEAVSFGTDCLLNALRRLGNEDE